jgi:mannosylglucosylglycerate synthase
MSKPRVAILHYSAPPVIGGVEFIIDQHLGLFRENGFAARLIVGRGGTGTRVIRIPEIASDGGPFRDVLASLARGSVPGGFAGAVRAIERRLAAALRSVDVCMLHNVLTMHFNLALTAALARLMERRGPVRFIGWTHDSTFTDPIYRDQQRADYPWSLLRQALPGCDYCVISKQRRRELARLFKVPARTLPVIPDGISVSEFYHLAPEIRALHRRERLFERDIVALTPTRIVRRKNLQVGFAIIKALIARGLSVRWIITGAPDPHNPDSVQYFKELRALRHKHGLERSVIFMCERQKERVSNEALRGLFSLSNLLLFPSHREGFGIPVLEAGLAGQLVVINDIPALNELAGPGCVFIREGDTPAAVARKIVRVYARSPQLMFQRTVIKEYSWSAIFERKILPAVTTPRTIWR